MKRFTMILAILVLGVMTSHSEMIKLKDGTVINGTIIEQNSEYLIIESSLGKVKIAKYRLSGIDYDGSLSISKSQSNPNIVIQNNSASPVSPINVNKGDALTKQRLEQILKSGKFKKNRHKKTISMLASQLHIDYNQMLYSNYRKKNFLLYSVLNVVPTLGSIIQGDFWGVAFISAGYFTSYMFLQRGHSMYSHYDMYTSFVPEAEASYMTAATMLIVTAVYSLVRPATYQLKLNRGLKKALFSGNSLAMMNQHNIYKYNDSYTVPLMSLSF